MSNPDLYSQLANLKNDLEDRERDIYIISGVLGGVNLILVIAVFSLIVAAKKIKKLLVDAKIEKQVADEMDALKYQAYTGEEVHRKMMASNNVPITSYNQPGGIKQDSEYAFNAPFIEDRVLPSPSVPGSSKVDKY